MWKNWERSKGILVIVFTLLFTTLFFEGQTNVVFADAAIRRPISNTNPMFVVRAGNAHNDSISAIWASVPDDLKPYTVVELIGNVTNSNFLTQMDSLLAECDQLGIKAIIQVANGWEGTVVTIPWLTQMYTNHPSFIGTMTAELYGTKYDFVAQMINLSSQYGGYVINNDYTNGNTGVLSSHSRSDMLTAMRAHPDNYIPVAKMTTNSRYHETEGIMAGLWASGLASNYGTNPDTWAWWETGRGKLFGPEGGTRAYDGWKAVVTTPEAEIAQVILQTAISGGTVFVDFENPEYMHFYGSTTPAFSKALIPTFRKIVQENLIPTRSEMRSKMQVAYWADNNNLNNNLYNGLYGDGSNKDWLKTTGRYHTVPILPAGANNTEKGHFANTVTVSQFASLFPTMVEKMNYFNAKYPAQTIGDGYAQYGVNGAWVLGNSYENTNTSQTVEIPTKINTTHSFKYTLPPQTYATVKETANKFTMHIGNYRVNKDAIWNNGPATWSANDFRNYILTTYSTSPDESATRTTTIQIKGHTGGSKPVVTVSSNATMTDQWDATNKIYTMNVTHNGPVDVVINAWGNNTSHPGPIESQNVALGKIPTFSGPITNSAALATDGNSSNSENYVGLNNQGLQWTQIDLGQSYNLNKLKVWHYFNGGRKYHDVIYQLSNDPNFVSGVPTVFNNDTDNSAGRGAGTDAEYSETSAGHTVTFNPVQARYVRLWSSGSTANGYNHYVEIEAYGSN